VRPWLVEFSRILLIDSRTGSSRLAGWVPYLSGPVEEWSYIILGKAFLGSGKGKAKRSSLVVAIIEGHFSN
jgi:hypothetical protein